MSADILIGEPDGRDIILHGIESVDLQTADGSDFVRFYHPDGTLPVTANGNYDVKDKAAVDVNVPSGENALPGVISGTAEEITITDLVGATAVRDYAFYNYANGGVYLFSITIPDTITSIGNYAFSGSGLTHFYGDEAGEKSPVFDTLESIGDYAFYNCSDFGADDVFYFSAIQTIGSHAFDGSIIYEIEIGANCTSIGAGAFANSLLETIWLKSTIPPVLIAADIFDNSQITTIYVPQGSLTTYQTAQYWSTYASLMVEDVE